MKRLSALLGVVALLIALAVPASQATAASPGQQVDLKVLLLTQTGNEPALDAWESALQREGTPFDGNFSISPGRT